MPYDQYSWPRATATIANAASLSAAVYISRANLVGIIMPAAWTAAALTFQASIDGDTYFDLYDQAGNEVNIPTAASRFVGGLDALNFGCFNYLKVRSGTTGVPVNQGASRDLTLVLRNATGA